jgi:uncharacterized protein YbjT (DUF2867 family)
LLGDLVLVTGATGYIGGRLVPRFLAAGRRVRCLARHPERLAGRFPGVEAVYGDLLCPETIRSALRDCKSAYYLVHSMSSGPGSFIDRDRLAASNFANLAANSSLERIVYLGGLGAGEGLSAHLESRHEVGQILRESKIPLTEFRAAAIIGSGSASFELIRYGVGRTPIIPCSSWANTPCQPIAIRDVLAYLIEALADESQESHIFEIGGSERLTYRQMLEIYAKERKLFRIFITFPLPFFLAIGWASLITPLPKSLISPLFYGLRCAVVVEDEGAKQAFPNILPISYTKAVQLALGRLRSEGPETNWFDGYSSLARSISYPPPLVQREGMYVESWQRRMTANAEAIFAQVTRLGGTTGWLGGDFLWKLRGWLDRLVGGPGMQIGRRHDKELRIGDPVDFWRVEALRPPRLLRLRAEMRVPGKAWLQFEVLPLSSGGSKLRATAFFEPHGLLGAIYWWAMYPFHRYIFSSMFDELAKRAAIGTQ